MQGARSFAVELGRKWSRGASLLLLMGFAVGFFAAIALVLVDLGYWLLQPNDMPDEFWWRHSAGWWKLSAVLWGPLAIGSILPQIGEMIVGWRAEDGEPETESLTQWAKRLDEERRQRELGGKLKDGGDR